MPFIIADLVLLALVPGNFRLGAGGPTELNSPIQPGPALQPWVVVVANIS